MTDEINNHLEQPERYVFVGVVETKNTGTPEEMYNIVGDNISEQDYVRSLQIHPVDDDDEAYEFNITVVTTAEYEPSWYVKSLETSMKKLKEVTRYVIEQQTPASEE